MGCGADDVLLFIRWPGIGAEFGITLLVAAKASGVHVIGMGAVGVVDCLAEWVDTDASHLGAGVCFSVHCLMGIRRILFDKYFLAAADIDTACGLQDATALEVVVGVRVGVLGCLDGLDGCRR